MSLRTSLVAQVTSPAAEAPTPPPTNVADPTAGADPTSAGDAVVDAVDRVVEQGEALADHVGETAGTISADILNATPTSELLADILLNSADGKDAMHKAGDLVSHRLLEVSHWIDQLEGWVIDYSLRTIGAILTFIIGWLIAKWISDRVGKWLTRAKRVDNTVTNYVQTLVRTLILLITFIAVLGKFGVETASIVGVISAASLAIGLALQGTLSNFAAGIMLLIFNPFRVGDEVEIAGQSGVVASIGIFATEITAWSGEYILVPNGEVWGKTIRNLTRNRMRRFELNIEFSLQTDHQAAIDCIRRVLTDLPNVLDTPEPLIQMTTLTSTGFVIRTRAWGQATLIGSIGNNALAAIKVALQEEGFEFPTQEIRVVP